MILIFDMTTLIQKYLAHTKLINYGWKINFGICFLAGSFARLCLAVLLLICLLHVVNASPSSADPVRGRPSSPRPPSSTAEVNMLIIATAALLVLAANAEAAAIQVVRINLYLLYTHNDD